MCAPEDATLQIERRGKAGQSPRTSSHIKFLQCFSQKNTRATLAPQKESYSKKCGMRFEGSQSAGNILEDILPGKLVCYIVRVPELNISKTTTATGAAGQYRVIPMKFARLIEKLLAAGIETGKTIAFMANRRK